MSGNLENYKYEINYVKGKEVTSDKLFPVPKFIGISQYPDSYAKVHGLFASQSSIDLMKDMGEWASKKGTKLTITGVYARRGPSHKSHFTGDKTDWDVMGHSKEGLTQIGRKLASDPRVKKILYSGPAHEQLWKEFPNKFDKKTLLDDKDLYKLHETHFDVETLNDLQYQKYKQNIELNKDLSKKIKGTETGGASSFANQSKDLSKNVSAPSLSKDTKLEGLKGKFEGLKEKFEGYTHPEVNTDVTQRVLGKDGAAIASSAKLEGSVSKTDLAPASDPLKIIGFKNKQKEVKYAA